MIFGVEKKKSDAPVMPVICSLRSAWASAQSDLSLPLGHRPFCCFVVLRLIIYIIFTYSKRTSEAFSNAWIMIFRDGRNKSIREKLPILDRLPLPCHIPTPRIEQPLQRRESNNRYRGGNRTTVTEAGIKQPLQRRESNNRYRGENQTTVTEARIKQPL